MGSRREAVGLGLMVNLREYTGSAELMMRRESTVSWMDVFPFRSDMSEILFREVVVRTVLVITNKRVGGVPSQVHRDRAIGGMLGGLWRVSDFSGFVPPVLSLESFGCDRRRNRHSHNTSFMVVGLFVAASSSRRD